MHRSSYLSLVVFIFAGCASQIPGVIKQPPASNLRLAEVRSDIERFRGSRIRWGGTIAAVENRKTETWIEVVARELDHDGRPKATDRSEGRFLVCVQGFLDPAVYAIGREITVTGTSASDITRPIGEYVYSYPMVNAEMVYLWESRPELPREYYYDPFWPHPYPWYPWYPWGYPYRYYPW
jgi:outer membrane lipoprotein